MFKCFQDISDASTQSPLALWQKRGGSRASAQTSICINNLNMTIDSARSRQSVDVDGPQAWLASVYGLKPEWLATDISTGRQINTDI